MRTDKGASFVILTLEFRKEGERWLGRCRELSTSTFASSFEEVEQELRELVGLHLNTLEDVGERERFLQEHGITRYTLEELPSEIRVHIPLTQNGGHVVETAAVPLPDHA